MSVDTTTRPLPTRTPTASRDRSVLDGVAVLAALSVGGAVIAVATGLSADVWDAMGPTGRLSIPIPMMLAQLGVAWVASGTRRRPAIVASVLLALVEPVCILSGFADGGYSDPTRTPLHVGYQLVFIIAIGVVGVLAARRLVLLLRRRA
jgi:hypothetical protein